MPPRRSTRVAAVAERASSALPPLPLAIVLHVFSLLPADDRARAACVCRGWRSTLEEPSLWARLDLSPLGGVTRAVTDAQLAGAAAKARGQLAALDVSDCVRVSFDALLAVVRANVGALRELRVGAQGYGMPQTLNAGRVERLLQAAPQLAACHAEVLGESSIAAARRMLRNEPPFQPLRLRSVRVTFADDAEEASVLEVAADLAAHASLNILQVVGEALHTPAALDAVVDVALARQLRVLRFWRCNLSPASVPALARRLGSGTLTTLVIGQGGQQLLNGPSAALLGAALRANSTLTGLYLLNVSFWRAAGAAAALLSALTGHASLRTLKLAFNNEVLVGRAAGAPLGALVAANAPALTQLNVSRSRLDDAALRPLFNALPANTHLRTLEMSHNNMSEAFARDVLLPAVRANASLRTLCALSDVVHPGAAEATALVAARGGGGGGGAA
jgi:hypothetical protein